MGNPNAKVKLIEIGSLSCPHCRAFEDALYRFLDANRPGLLTNIRERKILDDEIKAELTRVIKEAKEKFRIERGSAA